MSFNSALFLVFFPVVIFLYFAVAHRYRWIVLLLSSCYFYMCFIPVYIFILFGMILVDYCAGILIEKSVGRTRRTYLVLSLLSNLAILIIFKYFNFFNQFFTDIAAHLHIFYPSIHWSLALPIGLSFHTLQSMGYTIDVYKGTQKAERHLGIFALYVLFFPQLVAGPIERAGHMLHQFREEHSFDLARLGSGLRLMVWGFFMKVVIADRLALFVNYVFDTVQHYPGPSVLIATVFFAFQIYCDFAGYSLIAIGVARAIGFDLVQNFNRPYMARSIQDFWRRWHISLSSWLRDYVYIPLGGNKGTARHTDRNVLITFALSGLWHGAGWTYVCWGLLNGLYLIVSRRTEAWRARVARIWGIAARPRLHAAWQVLSTFMLTCFGWIVFRAHSVSDVGTIVSHLHQWGMWWKIANMPEYFGQVVLLGQSWFDFVVAIASIIFLLIAERWMAQRTEQSSDPFKSVGIMATVILVGAIFLLGDFRAQTFIYFQF